MGVRFGGSLFLELGYAPPGLSSATAPSFPFTMWCFYDPTVTNTNISMFSASSSTGGNGYALSQLGGVQNGHVDMRKTNAGSDSRIGIVFASSDFPNQWKCLVGQFNLQASATSFLSQVPSLTGTLTASGGISGAFTTAPNRVDIGCDQDGAGGRTKQFTGRIAECGIAAGVFAPPWKIALALAGGTSPYDLFPRKSLLFYAPLRNSIIDEISGDALYAGGNAINFCDHPIHCDGRRVWGFRKSFAQPVITPPKKGKGPPKEPPGKGRGHNKGGLIAGGADVPALFDRPEPPIFIRKAWVQSFIPLSLSAAVNVRVSDRGASSVNVAQSGRSASLESGRSSPSFAAHASGAVTAWENGRASPSGIIGITGSARSSVEGSVGSSFSFALSGSESSRYAAGSTPSYSSPLTSAVLATLSGKASAVLVTTIQGLLKSESSGRSSFSGAVSVGGKSSSIENASMAIGFAAPLSGRMESIVFGEGVIGYRLKLSGEVSFLLQGAARLHLFSVTQRYIARSAIDAEYIVGPALVTPYTASFVGEPPIYIVSVRNQDMPKGKNTPPIDAAVQVQTVTFDFGDGPYLPDGVTLTGTPVVAISVIRGNDSDPASRIVGGPIISTAPPPYGSNRPNTAVLVQLGDLPGELAYLLTCSCPRSDGDVAAMDIVQAVRVPGGP